MKILMLGGTGVMGTYLAELFNGAGICTYITSRQQRSSYGSIHYIKGNAMDDRFLETLFSNEEQWDAVLDFMSYKTEQFKNRLDCLLGLTKQYIFISTARVYGNEEHPIRESSPRLLDCSKDRVFLKTDEYSLTKARQENLLLNSGRTNYTIIRPCITYGNHRIQLGVYEKEEWLYRALHGRTIVFCDDIAQRTTTMTSGKDVARTIYKMVGNEKALGDIIHITCNHHRKWSDIIKIYDDALTKITGHGIKVKMVPLEKFLSCRNSSLRYQVVYDRVYDRDYDVKHLSSYIDVSSFVSPEEGLYRCLRNFCKDISFKNINWKSEAIKDRITSEHSNISEIRGLKNKFLYIRTRLIGENFAK